MPFSRLRQYLPRSARNDQEKLAQLTETFPDEDHEKLDQALKHTRGNYSEAVRIIIASQAQSSTSPIQLGPRRLQKPAQRQYANSHPNFVLNDAGIHPHHQPAPPFPNNPYEQYPGHAPPQYQPAFAPSTPHPGQVSSRQHYSGSMYGQPGPPTPVPQSLNQWTNAPMPSPPFPPPLHPPQQQPMYPWTPNEPPVDTMDSRGSRAVSLYELPPPDLMDYDMTYMIAVRMRPEWNKYKEDRHWDQVRRERSAALRWQMGEDRDVCTVM